MSDLSVPVYCVVVCWLENQRWKDYGFDEVAKLTVLYLCEVHQHGIRVPGVCVSNLQRIRLDEVNMKATVRFFSFAIFIFLNKKN